MAYSILADGLRDFAVFAETAPEKARKAARLAINQTTQRRGINMVRDLVREQVAFPAGYLEAEQRLSVTQLATDQNLQAAITGRSRPTSLARFAIAGSPSNPRAPVRVRVNPNRAETMDRAFLMRLRGSADSFNIGLAIRLKPGERVLNKNIQVRALKAGSGLYLLYGPSVDQVFRDVATDAAPAILDETGKEFFRQFIRLIG